MNSKVLTFNERELSIELDCSPASPRPDSYIKGVIEGTGLVLEDFSEPSKFFGNWTYYLETPEKIQTYVNACPILKERITSLYNSGHIRYGGW
jgi:hypothetical protein